MPKEPDHRALSKLESDGLSRSASGLGACDPFLCFLDLCLECSKLGFELGEVRSSGMSEMPR